MSAAYGGAIYNYVSTDYYGYVTNVPKNTLYNCTFLNNSAMYGGAIYLPYGELSLSNCKFINNSAHWFGGAIASDKDSKISVVGTVFENCRSVDDAGGAIYAFSTDLEVRDSTFNNCSANFAGAICSLNSEILISYSNFTNNLARYEGGAVYKMYGSGTVIKSNFTKNAALNGGALFSDNCTSFEIKNSEFASNAATGFGGAIFSNANPKLTVDGVTFTDNKASYNANMLNQSNFSPIVSSTNNYSLFVYKSLFNGTLPARYNLAENGFVTDVKNQQDSGNCWAFAALASLETCVLKASNKTFNFSVENMKNLIEMYSAYGWKMETNEGGYNGMPMGYLASWLGPVNATLDPFDDKGTLSPLLDSEMHIQNIYVLPARTSYTDNDAIKEAILKYGGLYASYYHSAGYLNSKTNAYYDPYTGNGNHAITVVGWDDDYSKNNFYTAPAGDGAFIVKNSWGSSWGDNGYFYISYYDRVLFAVNKDNQAFTYILNDTVRYTKNYQYDVAGMTDYLITGKKTVWYQNIYNATGNEAIAAVSTFFNTTVDYEISIYVNDVLQLTQNGRHEGSGYYTIPLKEYVPVAVGDIFKIVVKLANPQNGYAAVPISEQLSTTRCYYAPGVSYFSNDGKKWTDLYDYSASAYSHTYNSQVACLKAFTVADMQNTTVTLNNITPKVQEFSEIIATVTDAKGKMAKIGEVIFSINGTNYTAGVVDGVAKISVYFDEVGDYVISANYKNNGLYNGSFVQKTVSVTKTDVNLTADIGDIVYGENATVSVILPANVTGNVTVNVNNKNYTKNNVNGTVIFIISDLAVGTYNVAVSFVGDEAQGMATAVFEVYQLTPVLNITVNDIIEGENATVVITLPEDATGSVNVTAGDKSQIVTVVNGTAKVIFTSLPAGKYNITAIYSGDNKYAPANETVNFTVINNKITNLNISDIVMIYKDGTRMVAVLTDYKGNPIANATVYFTINGATYAKTTDANGTVSLGLNLVSNVYIATISYNGSDMYDGVSKNITVTINPTILSEDISLMYMDGTSFVAKFLDKSGKALVNTKITFNINGVFYDKVTDADGMAKLGIRLRPDVYILTAYNPVTGEEKGFNINVKSLIESHDLTKYYLNESRYEVTLYNKDGSLAVNKTVTFNINGVFYTKTSDANGVASLGISLRPGEYIITTIFDGLSMGNKVTVLPTLVTHDLTMKYMDGSRFTVQTLDGQGKALSNQNVSFNVNGVFYYRTTDSNGMADLLIRLMPGEYIITSYCNDFQTGNTIKIA